MALDLKDVKQLLELIRRSDLTEFELEQEAFKVRIKRNLGGDAPAMQLTQPPFAIHTHQAMAPMPAPSVQVAPAASSSTASASEAGFIFVKSPMVGTFYRLPSPESAALVDKGSNVKEDSVVCIIEAMKVMNEIQAELKGTIVEVLVESGTSVEYGQPLFKVRAG